MFLKLKPLNTGVDTGSCRPLFLLPGVRFLNLFNYSVSRAEPQSNVWEAQNKYLLHFLMNDLFLLKVDKDMWRQIYFFTVSPQCFHSLLSNSFHYQHEWGYSLILDQ
jgi:hypothetical protein